LTVKLTNSMDYLSMYLGRVNTTSVNPTYI
jgi:hypothetical protein